MRIRGDKGRAPAAGTALAVAALVVAAGCQVRQGAAPPHRPPGELSPSAARLVAYDSCGQLLDQIRTEALAEVGSTGLVGRGGVDAFASTGPATPTASRASAGNAATSTSSDGASAGATDGAGAGFSATNDQEAGVDEPDLAKTDGSLLVALRRSGPTLEVADVAGTPRLLGSIELAGLLSPTGLFLIGHEAVILGPGSIPEPQPQPMPGPLPPADFGVGGSSVGDGAVAGSGAAGSGVAGTGVAGTGVAGSGNADGSTSVGATLPLAAESPTTVVAVVDLSDPAHPAVARSFTIEGNEVDARLVGGRVEVVVTSPPSLPFVGPADGSPAARSAALTENEAIVRRSTAADWLPSVTSSPGGTTTRASCSDTMHTTVASGVSTVSVVPIDPNATQAGAAVTVVGDATTVYASTSSLYVATTAWPSSVGSSSPGNPTGGSIDGSPAGEATTDIHGFDLSNPAVPRYVGSGQVPGTLIGQYALSEYGGYLRAATTVGSATPPPLEGTAPATPSDNRVTVLQPQGGALVPVGGVAGLGAGEKIYAVRFLGATGYVVTFRQTDPLYVLDLRDPRNPKALGELPLTGYSSFLEPLADGRVLGVGQEVDPNLRSDGLQLSLFDVSDPAHPTLLAKDVLPGAQSSAQQDPHALLWWAPAHLVVLPVSQQARAPMPGAASGAPESSASGEPFDGAIAFGVSDTAITEAARISPPAAIGGNTAGSGVSMGSPGFDGVGAPNPGMAVTAPGIAMPSMPVYSGGPVERTLVAGSMLYTVSDTGILASDLASFHEQAWLAYP